MQKKELYCPPGPSFLVRASTNCELRNFRLELEKTFGRRTARTSLLSGIKELAMHKVPQTVVLYLEEEDYLALRRKVEQSALDPILGRLKRQMAETRLFLKKVLGIESQPPVFVIPTGTSPGDDQLKNHLTGDPTIQVLRFDSRHLGEILHGMNVIRECKVRLKELREDKQAELEGKLSQAETALVLQKKRMEAARLKTEDLTARFQGKALDPSGNPITHESMMKEQSKVQNLKSLVFQAEKNIRDLKSSMSNLETECRNEIKKIKAAEVSIEKGKREILDWMKTYGLIPFNLMDEEMDINCPVDVDFLVFEVDQIGRQVPRLMSFREETERAKSTGERLQMRRTARNNLLLKLHAATLAGGSQVAVLTMNNEDHRLLMERLTDDDLLQLKAGITRKMGVVRLFLKKVRGGKFIHPHILLRLGSGPGYAVLGASLLMDNFESLALLHCSAAQMSGVHNGRKIVEEGRSRLRQIKQDIDSLRQKKETLIRELQEVTEPARLEAKRLELRRVDHDLRGAEASRNDAINQIESGDGFINNARRSNLEAMLLRGYLPPNLADVVHVPDSQRAAFLQDGLWKGSLGNLLAQYGLILRRLAEACHPVAQSMQDKADMMAFMDISLVRICRKFHGILKRAALATEKKDEVTHTDVAVKEFLNAKLVAIFKDKATRDENLRALLTAILTGVKTFQQFLLSENETAPPGSRLGATALKTIKTNALVEMHKSVEEAFYVIFKTFIPHSAVARHEAMCWLVNKGKGSDRSPEDLVQIGMNVLSRMVISEHLLPESFHNCFANLPGVVLKEIPRLMRCGNGIGNHQDLEPISRSKGSYSAINPVGVLMAHAVQMMDMLHENVRFFHNALLNHRLLFEDNVEAVGRYLQAVGNYRNSLDDLCAAFVNLPRDLLKTRTNPPILQPLEGEYEERDMELIAHFLDQSVHYIKAELAAYTSSRNADLDNLINGYPVATLEERTDLVATALPFEIDPDDDMEMEAQDF